MKRCILCGEDAEAELCNTCSGLVEHLQHQMRYRETAKLRISEEGKEGRNLEDAQEILLFAAERIGLAINFEVGEDFVRGNTSGVAISVPREPRKKVAGYVVEDIDPVKAELELQISRQRVNLFTQLAMVDDSFTQMLSDERLKVAQLELLVEEFARERAEQREASSK